jgi:TPR repeat protein
VAFLLAAIPVPGQDQAQRGIAPVIGEDQPPYQNGGYFALIIGIEKYQAPLISLATPVHDAQEVASVLSGQYGFHTRLLLDKDATRSNILTALDQYRNTLKSNDSLLIYYAGHGYYDHDADRAYWLPVDADSPGSPNHISADDITAAVRALPSMHVLVVSDSCYSGDLTRAADDAVRTEGRPEIIERMLHSRSRNLMTSGGDEPVADGGPDGHSIFAYAFLSALKAEHDQAFTATDLFYGPVQQEVAGSSRQTPRYSILRNSNHEFGDFVFFQAQPPAQPRPAPTDSPAAASTLSSASPASNMPPPLSPQPTAAASAPSGTVSSPPAMALNNLQILAPPAAQTASIDDRIQSNIPKLPRTLPAHLSNEATESASDCENGNANSCSLVAIDFSDGFDKVHKDKSLAAAFNQRACELKNGGACYNVALAFENGDGVAQDKLAAAALYQQSCELNDGSGCWSLALMYRDGVPVAQNISRAIALLERACDLKDATGCEYLAQLYENQNGVPLDLPKAVTYYTRACDGDDGNGCWRAAILYEQGKGTPVDLARAAEFYRQACEKGYKNTCKDANRLKSQAAAH